MKKRFSVLLIIMAFIFTMGVFSSLSIKVKAFADSPKQNPTSTSKSAILLDHNSGTVIYANNELKRLPIASMCKIMTLLLCFEDIDAENLKFDEQVVVSQNSAGMGGSQVFLEANASYKVSDLIKSITVASANDACVAMAEKICGSEDNFVERMNSRAKELGMNDTVFANCTGLPKSGQYSCAKDVATMLSKLLEHQEYYEFSSIWLDKIEHPQGRVTEISNTNKLIRFYEGCDSGKTGYTSEAGHCLAASAKRNGMRLICVEICAADSKTRFREVSEMFNFGFANFTNKLVVDDRKPLDISVSVEKGKKDTVSVIADRPIYLFSAKNEKRAIELDFKPNSRIKAPVNKGDCVGELLIYENSVLINSVKVIANEDILKKTYFDYIKNVVDEWYFV